ncbi:MAG: HEAT repeat domain-containing protein [Acidobacteria bacterium]|nr:HEAT repeat domain-containing protein [Acidobacteriota bacterium]
MTLRATLERLKRVIPEKGTPQRLVFLAGVAFFFLVLLPLSFWYVTWHGWPLDTTEVERALAEPLQPSSAQQMLVVIGEKLSRGDRSRRWYPRIIELSQNPSDDLRQTVAWVMGKDPSAGEFHHALLELLKDPVLMVRRTAALSLAGFHDAAARPELEAMTRSHTVTAPVPGRLEYRVQPNDSAAPGTIVARIAEIDVAASAPGKVTRRLAQENTEVAKGQPIVEIAPDADQAAQAQRALRLLK